MGLEAEIFCTFFSGHLANIPLGDPSLFEKKKWFHPNWVQVIFAPPQFTAKLIIIFFLN